jgi:glycosyltransferase involved in cell wall biosynthesis
MKNKIYDIIELGFIPPRYGGVSVSIARLINKLRDDGYKVGGFYTSENKDNKVLKSPYFNHEFTFSKKYIWFNLFYYCKILNPYHVIHSHYSLEHMVYLWFFLHLLHKKLVVTVHNSMVHSFYLQCDAINRFFLKRVANHSDVTWIAVSNQAKEEMLRLPINFRNPIQVIPAYIPEGQTESETLPEALQNYIIKYKKNIVFYGHSFMLHDGNDVYGFTDAITLYSELQKRGLLSVGFVLCLAENSDIEKIKILHQTARELNIDDKIYWQLGPIENMKALWNQIDVYIRPTCTDGDSVAVREALDLGAQVVASDVCPRPDRTITYHFGNVEDFANKVEKAIDIGHTAAKPDFSNYYKLKAIYTQLLVS